MTGLFCESEGEKAYKRNAPQEAINLLEKEIADGTASSLAYNFLGLSYFQLGNYGKAVEVFGQGLKVSGTNKKVLSFNQGNAYFSMRDFESAIKSYSLAISADSKFSAAILNRANSYVSSDHLQEAVSDYESYLLLEVNDPQSGAIENMINALKEEIERRHEEEIIAAQEAERLAEEERRLQEEMERIRLEEEKRAEEERILREKKEAEERRIREEKEAEERRIREEKEAEERRIREEREAEERRIEAERKAAEAERRRKLLEEVANSLHNTDSTNMSSGAEDLMEYEQESELD